MEAERERLLARGAVWAGAALSTALVLPIPTGGEWVSMWELADALGEPAFVVAPAMGLVLLLAVAIPRLPYALRATLVALGGVVAILSLRDLVLHPEVIEEASREFRELSLPAVDGLVGGLLLACALEVAMQRRRESRWFAAFALIGWLHLMARWLVPLVGGEIESAPLIGMAEAVTELDRTPGLLLLIVPALPYLLLPALQALLALIRLATGPERRGERRWRSSWAAVLLTVLPPVLLAIGIALVTVVEQEGEILVAGMAGSFLLFGATLGAVWGVGHFLPVLADGVGRLSAGLRSDRPEVRRGARALAAVLVLLVLGWLGHRVWVWTRPDPRDRALASLVDVTQDAIVAATMGEPYDPRWNGGYSELDIRASRGALRDVVGQGASVEPVLFAFDLAGHGGVPFSARVAVIDGEVLWADLERGWPGGDLARLDAVPALEGTVRRASEALSGGDCVEPLRAGDLAGMPERASELLESADSVERACHELSDGGGRELGDARPEAAGHVGDYLMLVRSGDRWLALRGSWHAGGGRLWLGRANVTPL